MKRPAASCASTKTACKATPTWKSRTKSKPARFQQHDVRPVAHAHPRRDLRPRRHAGRLGLGLRPDAPRNGTRQRTAAARGLGELAAPRPPPTAGPFWPSTNIAAPSAPRSFPGVRDFLSALDQRGCRAGRGHAQQPSFDARDAGAARARFRPDHLPRGCAGQARSGGDLESLRNLGIRSQPVRHDRRLSIRYRGGPTGRHAYGACSPAAAGELVWATASRPISCSSRLPSRPVVGLVGANRPRGFWGYLLISRRFATRCPIRPSISNTAFRQRWFPCILDRSLRNRAASIRAPSIAASPPLGAKRKPPARTGQRGRSARSPNSRRPAAVPRNARPAQATGRAARRPDRRRPSSRRGKALLPPRAPFVLTESQQKLLDQILLKWEQHSDKVKIVQMRLHALGIRSGIWAPQSTMLKSEARRLHQVQSARPRRL